VSTTERMRSEGVAVRPFAGSRELQDVLERVLSLELKTGQESYSLKSADRVTIPPSEMRVAGISIKINDLERLFSQVDPMVMSRDDVNFLVVAIDGPTSPLRTSDVLRHASLQDLTSEMQLNVLGSQSDSAVLSNVHGRYSIEFALVHNKDVTSVSAIKPRRKGALLAKAVFTLTPTGVNDQPKPKPMDQETKSKLGLPQYSWFYLKASSSLLEATSFEDAFDFYVDKELLETLKVAKPAAKAAVEGTLMTALVQGLCQEVAARSADFSDSDIEDIEASAVVRMLKKLLNVKTFEELTEQLQESPAKVASQMLAVKSLFRGLMKSLEEVGDE
jgi:hypothetical protein